MNRQKQNHNKYLLIFIFLNILFNSCSTVTELIPLDVDRVIGEQFSKQLENNPMEDAILDSTKNKEIYTYLAKIKNNILLSDKIRHKNDFPWRVKIIKNDSILNAFCIAGGYIYVYTGLIKFLDNEAELAGVLAHEIAHADNRHTTIRMVSQYGTTFVFSLITGGDMSFLVNIARELLGLSFSRGDEQQADACAVSYMYDTDYDPRGVAGFFKKMIDKNKKTGIPEFLSTHPASESRIDEIEQIWKKMGAKKGNLFTKEYTKAEKYLK